MTARAEVDARVQALRRLPGEVAGIRERPILFSGPMVRAILDGSKTQTRRVIKPSWSRCLDLDDDDDRARTVEQCPYGQPGDRLWVRETFALHHAWDQFPPTRGGQAGKRVWFRADARMKRREPEVGQWRPSIHLPRWASRITLEVTSVHVERLHSITKEDAIAEGAHAVDGPLGAYGDGPRWSMDRPHPVEVLGRDEGWKRCLGTPQMAFANLWNRINGLDAWYANPWVWVVSFRKLAVARG